MAPLLLYRGQYIEEVKDHVILWLTDKLVMAGSACLPVQLQQRSYHKYTAPLEMYHKVEECHYPLPYMVRYLGMPPSQHMIFIDSNDIHIVKCPAVSIYPC